VFSKQLAQMLVSYGMLMVLVATIYEGDLWVSAEGVSAYTYSLSPLSVLLPDSPFVLLPYLSCTNLRPECYC